MGSLEVDFKNKAIFVKQVEGKASTYWRGSSGNIHSRILQKMRQVLLEDTEYSYLQNNAEFCLQEVRKLIRSAGLYKQNILQLEKINAAFFCGWVLWLIGL